MSWGNRAHVEYVQNTKNTDVVQFPPFHSLHFITFSPKLSASPGSLHSLTQRPPGRAGTHTQIHTHKHTHTTHTYTHTQALEYDCHVHTHSQSNRHRQMCSDTHTHTHTHTKHIHTYTHTHTHTDKGYPYKTS